MSYGIASLSSGLGPGLPDVCRALALGLALRRPGARVAAVLCLVHFFSTGVAAVQVRPEASKFQGLPAMTHAVETGPTEWSLGLRPVPTPCRSWSRPRPSRSISVSPRRVGLQTLLWQSMIQQQGHPFYTAATLLDTLFEEAIGSIPCAGYPKQLDDSARDCVVNLRLEDLIPEPCAADTDGLATTPFQLMLPSAHSAHDQLHFGTTPLGFCYDDITTLFRSRVHLRSLAEIQNVCSNSLCHCTASLGAFFQDLQAFCAPRDLFCYTDGSFTPGAADQQELCGWACVFIDPHAGRIGALWGSYPVFLCPDNTLVSPFVGEVSGLLAAALSSVAAFQDRPVHFRSDCISALAIAEGRCSFQADGLSQSMRHAFAFRQSLPHLRDTYAYVPGHSGQLGNDLADVLSKAGARQGKPSCGLDAGIEMLCFWLGAGVTRLSWAATATSIGRGDNTLPPLNQLSLGHDAQHAGLSARQFLAPFLPPGLADAEPTLDLAHDNHREANPDSDESHACHIKIASFNVLSLGAALETDTGVSATSEGIAFRPSRAQILASQLHNGGVVAACLQETRCEAGTHRTGGYIRFSSGGARGQWGIEWRFLEHHPLLAVRGSHDADVKAKVSFQEKLFTTVLSEPRRLFVRCACPNLRLLFVGLHAPHRATEADILCAWWQDTLLALRTHCRDDLIILAGDLNASVGSNPSDSVGNLDAEDEDEPGAMLHGILREFALFLPATWDGIHSGPSHTYHQKRGNKLCRPDYIGLPLSWRFSECHSYTAPEIHAAHSCQDHVATITDVQLQFGRITPERRLGRHRIRASDVLDPQLEGHIEKALQALPNIPWACSVHSHAALLAHHVHASFKHIKKAKPTTQHRTYLREDTWRLQRRVASIRVSLHRLQHRCRQQICAACFDGWARGDREAKQAAHHTWLRRSDHVAAAHVAILRRLGLQLKKACKRDRDAYIGSLAERLAQGPTSEIFANLHAVLGHRRKKRYQVDPLPAVQQSDGTLCPDQDACMTRWRQHFGDMDLRR